MKEIFRLSASHFLVLVPQKVTKEDDTQPSRPSAPLRCSTKWASIETRPDKPHTSWLVAELEQPMADFPHFVSATQRDEWDLSRQTHNVEIWKVKNSNSFYLMHK
jgi:hypothetical protein